MCDASNETDVTRSIGGIENFYGGILTKEENGFFWWTITDYKDERWEKIPEYLFLALNRFEDERYQLAAQEQADG
jgi:hypothetical protein